MGICFYFYFCRFLEYCRKYKYFFSFGEVFVFLVSSFLENFLDYRIIIMYDESKENRMSCIVNVLVCVKFLGWLEGIVRLFLYFIVQIQVDFIDIKVLWGDFYGVWGLLSSIGTVDLVLELAILVVIDFEDKFGNGWKM